MIWTVVLATLMKLNLWANDVVHEDPQERADRLQTAAIAISAAAANREEVAFLLTLGEAETGFAAYTRDPLRCVSTGPRGMRCDHGNAYGYWSLHRAACPALWDGDFADDDPRAVYLGAQCAVALYRYGRFACKEPGGAFALYAGRRCGDSIGPRRAQRMTQIKIMLDHGGLPWPAEPHKP